MANSGRNLGGLLLVAVLCSIVIFLGCGGGGGGNGDDPIVGLGLSFGQVAGTLNRSGVLANVKGDVQESLLADVNFSQSNVYLEERPTLRATPSASGAFLISSVPFGNYHVVASMTSTSGLIYKVRTGSLVGVAQAAPTGNTTVTVTSADKADRQVKVELKDASGTPVVAAQVVIWGETFTNLGNGLFLSPVMPANAVAEVTVTPSGGTLQTTIIPGVAFTASAPPTISATLPPISSTNHPPIIASLRATPTNSVAVNGSLSLVASATDADGDQLRASWSVTAGTLSNVSTFSATWNAPSYTATATVYYLLTEAVRSPAFSASATTIVSSTGAASGTGLSVSIVSTGTSQLVAGGTVINFAANTSATLFSWTADSGTILSGVSAANMTWQAPAAATGSTTISTLRCTVSDGALNGSAAVTVTVTGGPIASITAPVGTVFYPGARSFSGTGRDATGVALFGSSLRWYVALGAGSPVNFGQGNTVPYTFTTHGSYTISLSATDAQGAVGTTTKTLSIVNSPPTAVIASPPAGSVFPFGSPVNLVGNGTDLEDVTITATNQIGWFSNREGFIGSGSPRVFTPTLAGTHTITLGVVDANGAYGTVTTSMYVNQPPNMSFTPASDATFFAGYPVTFSGAGTDPDSGTPVPAASMSWFFNGTAWPVGTATFQQGQPTPLSVETTVGHLISLVGVDANGQTGTTTQRIYTGVSAASITFPVAHGPGPRYDTGVSLAFVGTPSNTERKNVNVAWILDRGMATATTLVVNNANLTTAAIASGWHTLTYIGTDSANVASFSTIGFWVNRLPTATINITTAQYATGPANTPIILIAPTANVDMSVTATDLEIGGTVPTGSISWSVDGGASFDATGTTRSFNFAPGTATVVIRAWDNFGFYREVTKVFWVWEGEQYTASISNPAGLTTDNTALYVAELPATGRISKHTRLTGLEGVDGDLVFASASGTGSLTVDLRDITFDGTNLLTIETNNDIQEFDTNLASAGNILAPALNTPNSLTFGGGGIYVADTGNNRLAQVDPANGAVLANVGLGAQPFGVAFQAAGSWLYVTLPASNLVRRYSSVLNPDGTFTGTGATNPQRVTVGTNFIFVSDGTNKVYLFSQGGALLGSFGVSTPGLGQLTNPMGMVVIGTDLYIAESGANRITRIRNGSW